MHNLAVVQILDIDIKVADFRLIDISVMASENMDVQVSQQASCRVKVGLM